MDAKMTLATICFNAFKNRLQDHLDWRDASFGDAHQIYMGKSTRTYQHFQIVVMIKLHPRHPYGDSRHPIIFDCQYNTKGDLQLFVKLNEEDPFKGAADFDPDYGRCRHFVEDVIRSFFDASPTFTTAILKI